MTTDRRTPPRHASGDRRDERLNAGRRDPRHQESIPPLTAEESERLWRTLKSIEDGQQQLQAELDQNRGKDLAWRAEVNDKLEEHARDIHELKKTTLAVGELKLEQQKANTLLERIDKHNTEQDASINALVSEKKAEASAQRSKLYSALAIAGSILVALINQYGPAILKALQQ